MTEIAPAARRQRLVSHAAVQRLSARLEPIDPDGFRRDLDRIADPWYYPGLSTWDPCIPS